MVWKISKTCVIGFLLFAITAATQNPKSEYAVKGAILCKICSYAKWPVLEEVFVIGIVGTLPEGSKIVVPKGYLISGKKVELRQLNDLAEIANCKAIFITEQASPKLDSILSITKKLEILTFCDSSELLRQGLMFNLVMVGSKVKFEINRKPIRETNVSVSAPIYEVALRIID